MSCQMRDYRLECCWRERFIALLTARLSGLPTTPHGMHAWGLLQHPLATEVGRPCTYTSVQANVLMFLCKALSCNDITAERLSIDRPCRYQAAYFL